MPLLRQSSSTLTVDLHSQDREAEPRFTGPPSGRGDYGGAPRGGGGYGGAAGYGGGPPMGGGGRQLYVSNVCCPFTILIFLIGAGVLTCVAIASLQRWLARHEGSVSTSGYATTALNIM